MGVGLPLSVIVPIYNDAKTIAYCLDSLVAILDAAATIKTFMANDGNQGETLEVVTNYQTQHPEQCIRIVGQTNQGQSATRDKGLEVTQGAYVWFIDTSDWVGSVAASYLLTLITKESCDKPYDMLCFGVRNIADEGEEVSSEWMDTSVHDFDQLRCIDSRVLLAQRSLLGGVYSFLWRCVMPEEHQARFMEGSLREDALFYWHYTTYTERVLPIPIVAYCHYQKADSTIRNPNTLRLRGISRLEGSFRLLECAKDQDGLRSFYLKLASSFYRSGLRMIIRYSTVFELKSYTQRMK